LSADPWPAGVGRVVLAEVDSTNAEAARRAAAGAGPTWILAGFQTVGRGRRGRAWVSPRGNFHATLMDRPAGTPGQVALFSFAAGLALREALAALAPGAYAFKWPNDVLLNGGKVAGILLESAGAGGPVEYLAVGMGVNLIAAPDPADLEPGARRPVSVLAETGVRVEPAALLDRLAPAYARWSAQLLAEGFGPLREAWLAHAAGLGAPLTARTGAETLTGIFETIDGTGALVLLTPDGRRSIPAGDVYF
jgi:BirA family biotin operon repressor/biotin-[acetyl-CoA-carboxylase] ligase